MTSTTTTATPTRADYIKLLKRGECTITYRKQSTGKTEKMNGTLKTSIIPESEIPTGKLGGDNKEVIAVWNTQKNAWRSARVDSIKTIKLLD